MFLLFFILAASRTASPLRLAERSKEDTEYYLGDCEADQDILRLEVVVVLD